MPEHPSTGYTTIEQAVLYLASRCDGAIEQDGEGFNGIDTHYGKSLAKQLNAGRPLSPKQAIVASRLCTRYRGQLERAGLSTDFTLDTLNAKLDVATKDAEASQITVGLTLDRGEKRLSIKSPWRLKDAISALPGRRWVEADHFWTLPSTPAGAESIGRLVKAERLEVIDGTDGDYHRLLEEARDAYRAQNLKTASDADLPDLPVKLGLDKNGNQMTPWTHQRQAFAFARGRRATMLGMDMGTGKSLTTVGLLEDWDAKRVLILCPKSAVGVWPREFRAATSHDWTIVRACSGSAAKKAAEVTRVMGNQERSGGRAVYVLNYESAWRDHLSDALLAVNWDVVICDESHRIKSPGAVSSKFVHRLGKRATRRLCLTGTPMPHSPLDVYGQYRFLDEGIYGTSFARFRNRYAIMGGYEGREVIGMNQATAADLAQRFGSIAYQCKADDVLDLPEALEVTRTCQLEPTAAKAYRQMEAFMVAGVGEGTVSAANAGVKVLRLQQMTSGYAPTDEDDPQTLASISTAKRDLLKDVLADAPEGQPVVVFARFRPDLATIKAVAAELNREYRELSGSRRDLLNEDAKMVEGFTGIGGVQIQAGGVGIDLTAARLGVYYSVGYSLGDYEQSLKRMHRPGQEHKVLYVHLVCENTIDQTVYHALSERKSVVESVLAAAKGAGNKSEIKAMESDATATALAIFGM